MPLSPVGHVAVLAAVNVFVHVTIIPALNIHSEVLLLELIPEVARHVMLLRLVQP